MDVPDFAVIKGEFIEQVHSIVWCAAATVDRQGRPRSRILHPIWEGATGWICTHRQSHKSKHLEHNPYISLTYIPAADIMKPVHVDCVAAWENDLGEKRRVWELFKRTPPPLGFDPAVDFVRPDHENFGLLKLTPW